MVSPLRRGRELMILVLSLAVAWNYWLPLAEDFYNDVTEAGEQRSQDLRNVDFFAYYLAGDRFGKGQNPYYYGQGPDRRYSEYLYPPILLPAYRALSTLPYDQARLLWLALYLTAYAALAAAVVRAALPEHRRTLLGLSMLLTLCSFPLLRHIHNGQSDVFAIVLILWSWLAYARGGWLAASGLLALATLLKVNPALLLIYFVLYRRDCRFLGGFLSTLVLMVLVSLAFVPASLYRDYVLDVLPTVGRGTAYWLNQSLLRFVPAEGGWLAPIVTAVGFGLFATFAAWVSRQHPEAQRRLAWPIGSGPWRAEGMFVMNLAVILVFSGKAWSMAYVWMIMPMALLLTYLLHQPVRWWFRAAAAFATLLLLAKVYGYPLLDSLNLVGSVLLLVLLGLGSLRRDGLLSGSS